VAVSNEHKNKSSVFIIGSESFEELNNCQLVKEGPAR
jgi:hypothetical protein